MFHLTWVTAGLRSFASVVCRSFTISHFYFLLQTSDPIISGPRVGPIYPYNRNELNLWKSTLFLLYMFVEILMQGTTFSKSSSPIYIYIYNWIHVTVHGYDVNESLYQVIKFMAHRSWIQAWRRFYNVNFWTTYSGHRAQS